MTLPLDGYKSIESNLFVKIEVDYYKANEAATPSSVDLLFSDRLYPFTIGTDTYTGLGKLMSISTTTSELRPSSKEINISIAGVPNSSISEIINSRIKGSPVTIYRGLFDITTNQFLSGHMPTHVVNR